MTLMTVSGTYVRIHLFFLYTTVCVSSDESCAIITRAELLCDQKYEDRLQRIKSNYDGGILEYSCLPRTKVLRFYGGHQPSVATKQVIL